MLETKILIYTYNCLYFNFLIKKLLSYIVKNIVILLYVSVKYKADVERKQLYIVAGNRNFLYPKETKDNETVVFV